MKKSLDEEIKTIINDKSFNDLPFEQRKLICKFLVQNQILILWQAINNYPDLVCGAYKVKIRKWLKNCVEIYKKEYGETTEKGDVEL